MRSWLAPDSSVIVNILELEYQFLDSQHLFLPLLYYGYSYTPTFSLNIIIKLEMLRDTQRSLGASVL